MKKLLLSLTSLSVISTTSLSLVSCSDQEWGWNGFQDYWTVLNHDNFKEWMENVDLITNEQWKQLDEQEKEASWITLTNVDLNNFMSVMNLVYQYLVSSDSKDTSQVLEISVDDLKGFYNNFGYSILNADDSFAQHLLSLKKDNQPLITKWDSLTQEQYLTDFKSVNLDNNFQLNGQPIKISVTSSDGKTPLRGDIIDFWKPVFELIHGISQSSMDLDQIWKQMASYHFEAFIFKINFFWPVNNEDEKEWWTSFDFNLTFDF